MQHAAERGARNEAGRPSQHDRPAALAFALMSALAQGMSALTGTPALAMALGFPVSIFGVIVPRETAPRARFISTLCLMAASLQSK